MLPAEGTIKQIQVEIDGLANVAAAMRQELEEGFRTQVTPLHDAMRPGASIGGPIVGADWVGLQNAYSFAMQATLDTLYNLDLGTQAVADAAAIIAAEYGSTDAFSHATIKDVHDVISAPAPQLPVAAPGSFRSGAVTGE